MNIFIKPFLTVSDIAAYLKVSKPTAYKIVKICKQQLNGIIQFRNNAITTDSFCQYIGTTREKEIYLLKGEINETNSKEN
jgi:hypothetical protein